MDLNPKRQRPRRSPNRNGDARYELPRAVLLGGDPIRGGRPCAPGHAGRASLSLATRTSHVVHARADMMRHALQAFAAALLLALVQALAPTACSPTAALAASGTDPKTITMSTEYRHQLDGQEAYCTVISVSPPPRGTVVSSWTSGPLMLDYVLYHSDGGFDVQYGWEPARYAVWAIMHNDKQYLTTYGSGEAMPEWFSSQVKALYGAAESWVEAGAQGPERGCSRVYSPNSSEYQPLAICVPQLGGVSLTKVSSLPAISDNDACYSLAGAEYTLYSDAACTTPVTTLVTDKDGTADAASLSQGTYYVQETKAPKGFEKNEETYEVKVLPLETTAIAGGRAQDNPLFVDVGLLLRKGDAEMILTGDETRAQGDATLAGAQFLVSRYANTMGNASGEATRSWTIQTDGQGVATLDDEHLVAGDEPYRDEDGAIVLPLGTYTIEEVAAPEGYLAGGQSCCFVVEQQGSRAVRRIVSGPTRSSERPGSTQFLVPNDVVRGGVKLGKVDMQRLDHVAQGAATLEGAMLAIELTSDQPVVVDGTTYEPGSVVTTLTTSADGCAETASDALPYGTYVAYEIEAPEGYRLTGRDEWSMSFQIRENGVVVDLSGAGDSVPDQVKRGDLAFVKVDGQSMRRMAGIPFAIESLTTGERHVIVTDDNGQCSTSASFNAHTHLTNANDGVAAEDAPQIDAQSLDAYDAEVEIEAEATDEAGILEETPAEDEELEGEALTDLVEKTVADAVEAFEDEVPDEVAEETAHEETAALTAEETSTGDDPADLSEGEAAEIDEVAEQSTSEEALAEVAEDTPEPLALVASATESPYDASAGIWFSGGTDLYVEPDDNLGALPYDTYRVSELRCAANEGYDLVSFEIRVSRDYMEIDGGTVDDHALPTVQTILATTASQDDGSVWQLTDTVYFNNLATDGTEYELRGTLHYVTEDGLDGGVVTDASGNEAVASTLFTPKASSGSVDVSFTLDADLWRGTTVVAFEELWLDGQLLASHADITDTDQSVNVPRIATTLTDTEGASEVLGADHVELVDTVSYEGLTPGKTYQLMGTLMDRETGEPVLRADGTPVTAQRSFVPDASSGTATVTFTFDGSLCQGHTVVAFESLWHEGVELAVHADLEDEPQSVTIPGIQTTAANALDGSHLLLGSRDASIVDTVAFQGLVPGNEYLLKGSLVNRASGEAVQANGQPVQAELSFTPDASSGSVDMTFTFDAAELLGTEVTVFEQLYHDDKLVATHEDLSSDSQSLSIPKIGTVATSPEGTKTLDAATDQRIIDTVRYEGLEPGANYLISGVIHLRDERGNDAGLLVDAEGKPVAASAPLVPEASSGEASLEFAFDASDLGECDLVVFELLMNADTETLVATHEDISDGGQTVTVRKPSTPPSTPTPKNGGTSRLPKTGDVALPTAAVFAAALFALGLGGALRIQDRRKQRHSQKHMG